MHQKHRKLLIREGVLEPMILAAIGNTNSDVEVQREAAATLCNLALDDGNKLEMLRRGVLTSLIKVAQTEDIQCRIYSVAALANLAEMGAEVQRKMLDESCI